MTPGNTAAPRDTRAGQNPEAPRRTSITLPVQGPLTLATAERFLDSLRGHAGAGAGRVVLDLEEVPAIDVCGVAALLRVQALVEAGGGTLELRVNPTVRRALVASRTITAFRLSPGKETPDAWS